jgi:hypothetical protein
VSFLAGFGNVIGRGPGWRHGGTFHATNLYVLLVGPTSSGRKGTACDEALRALRRADPDWAVRRVAGGLSTGEGVVHQVRDPLIKRRKAKNASEEADADGMVEELEDPGEPDRRLLVVEPEFAQTLKVMQREGNTLSPVVRKLWDSGQAGSLTRSPYRTTGALVSIVGHISREELTRKLDDTEIANVFANRFLVVCSRRSKSLPFGGNLPDEELIGFADRLDSVIDRARSRAELDMAEDARAVWLPLYEQLTRDRPGLFGAVCGRAAPIVRRVAVLYALVDGDSLVREPHLRAAAAVWRYCEESTLVVFGDKLGRALADKLRAWLRDAGIEGLSREQIREKLGGKLPAGEIDEALDLLAEYRLAARFSRATGGRPQERWLSLELVEETEQTETAKLRSPLSYVSSTPESKEDTHPPVRTVAELSDAELLAAFPGSALIGLDDRMVPAGAPHDPLCAHPNRHAPSSWRTHDGRLICAVCHPPATPCLVARLAA